MSVNKTILLGRLTKDPDVSYTNSGMAVCKFTLATSEKIKGEEKTEFHRCTAFDKRGEAIGRYVTKGQQLFVEGKIQYGSYEKDNITRYTTDIIVTHFDFVGTKPQNNNHDNNTPEPDDDIPF